MTTRDLDELEPARVVTVSAETFADGLSSCSPVTIDASALSDPGPYSGTGGNAALAADLRRAEAEGTPLGVGANGYGTSSMVCAGETESGDRVWLDCDKLDAAMVARLSAELRETREALTATQARCTALLEERRAVDWTSDVRALFAAFEQVQPSTPEWPDAATVKLRRKLVQEEFNELMQALEERDMPEVADGAIDLCVVTVGLLVAFGIDPRPLWRLVQAANLTKAGGPISADGKRMKPPGFVPPDVAALLREQGWRAPGESQR